MFHIAYYTALIADLNPIPLSLMARIFGQFFKGLSKEKILDGQLSVACNNVFCSFTPNKVCSSYDNWPVKVLLIYSANWL